MIDNDVNITVDGLIAGALYDFVGYLTSNNNITVGSSKSPDAILKSIQEWAKLRGLNIKAPNIMRWETNIHNRIKTSYMRHLDKINKEIDNSSIFVREKIRTASDEMSILQPILNLIIDDCREKL